MNRFALPCSLVLFVVSAHLTGCSSTNDGADPSARPSGCKVNECDVGYSRCKATHAPPTDYCTQCNNECANVGYEQIESCFDTCSDICSRPSTPDTYCEDAQTSCQKTAQNGICTDGVDPANVPGDVTMSFSWKPPASAHAGACSDAALASFASSCLSKGTDAKCRTFATAHAACNACIITSVDADSWGALVSFSAAGASQVVTNDVGCVAALEGDTSSNGCGAKLFARDVCQSRCTSSADVAACTDFANTHDCKTEVDAAAACSQKLGIGQNGSAYQVCHVDQGDDDAVSALTAFFCGN